MISSTSEQTHPGIKSSHRDDAEMAAISEKDASRKKIFFKSVLFALWVYFFSLILTLCARLLGLTGASFSGIAGVFLITLGTTLFFLLLTKRRKVVSRKYIRICTLFMYFIWVSAYTWWFILMYEVRVMTLIFAIISLIFFLPFATFSSTLVMSVLFMALQVGATLYLSTWVPLSLRWDFFMIACCFFAAMTISIFSRGFIKQRNELRSVKKKIEERNLELQEANVKLTNALEKMKIMRGFIPICSSCKKIRNDEGYWTQLETYIHEHSEAEFSHGLCPDCAKKLYPDMDLDEDSDR